MKPDSTITRVLKGSAYAPEVIKEILPLVYDELKRLAAHFLDHEPKANAMMATELVHEAYVRLFGLEKASFKNS